MEKLKDLIRKYPIIDIAVAIAIAIIPFLFVGEDSVISGAMIQAGWCIKGDNICLLKNYFLIIVIVLSTGIILQFSFITIRRLVNRIVVFLRRIRPANFLITSIVLNDEIYVVVYNNEFWLYANKVIGCVEYATNEFHRVKDYVKWDSKTDNNLETSIPRKKYKVLHFASINRNDKTFTICLTEQKETFSFPREGHAYNFPLLVSGNLSFIKQIHRVVLKVNKFVVIDYKEKDDLSVRCE